MGSWLSRAFGHRPKRRPFLDSEDIWSSPYLAPLPAADQEWLDGLSRAGRNSETFQQIYGILPGGVIEEHDVPGHFKRALEKSPQWQRLESTSASDAYDEVAQYMGQLSLEDQFHQVANRLLDLCLDDLKVSEVEKARQVPVRISWTGLVNAVTVALPSGQGVAILIDQSTAWLSRGICRALFGILEEMTGDSDRLDFWHLALLAHCLTYRRTGSYGSLARAQAFQIETIKLERDNVAGVSLMSMRMQQFMLLHELGHALLDHVSNGRSYGFTDVNGVEVSKLEPGHLKEYEADEFAADRFISSADPADSFSDWAFLAGFFECLSISEPVRSRAGSHPPWRDRWQRVRDRYASRSPDRLHEVDVFQSLVGKLGSDALKLGSQPWFLNVTPETLPEFADRASQILAE